ncbi:origin recognition complex subunit 2-domain-containing protein [Apodospora peruviana]|uniref:Origin recognition complex subunit 2 n=1 Tax=Apodospora peruviana TaxID=516989 RepID=A0AAE0II79_9PEZI|nr:origin recognition complex subunit 2-domain-containing protein [Apodospora peruviana]
MPRRKAADDQPGEGSARKKQKRSIPVDPYQVPEDEEDPVPPKKRIRTSLRQQQFDDAPAFPSAEDEIQADDQQVEPTPTKKRRGRPPKNSTSIAGTPNGKVSTPAALRQKATTETPVRFKGLDTPSRRNNADRSARRKSARALIDRVVGGAISDDDEGEEEDIVREIYESSDDGEGGASQQEDQEGAAGADDTEGEGAPVAAAATAAATPSKRRGRPPGSVNRKRSPTPPPRDLPPYEQYFYQNKPGQTKTSNNSLTSLNLLTHEEYFSLLRQVKDPHAADVDFLQSLQAESFPQWAFELSQGFSPCLYGYGSKRRLVHQFATYLSTQPANKKSIVIINGYVRTTSIREILSTIGSAINPSHKIASGNPVAMVQNLFSLLLPSLDNTTPHLILMINSIDAPPLRRTATQSILAQLAAHPKISLVCSADTPDFHLFWDSGLRSSFNFCFHDCTTFAPFAPAEIDVVDEVHELLGRMARRVGGKEGVTFVLRSLPENAKSLFRLLVGEVLVVMDEGGGGGTVGDRGPGIEYRILYNKAVEEFICSSEMAFRTLLKEFHDHQIIESYKDSIGTELLSLPFRKNELEAILEDLMS